MHQLPTEVKEKHVYDGMEIREGEPDELIFMC